MFQSKTLWINTCGFCARSTLLSYADKSAFRKKTKPTAVVTSWNLNQASANSFVSMGVRGLTSFVEGNTHFLQGVKFRDSWLLIDGSSLYFQIYFHHGLDQLHGGDYDAFSCLLKQFFAALAACNIQAFVVLDGGIDPSDKKLDTLRQRLQTKIKDADNISHSRRGSVLPLLTKEVFIQVLIQIGVPLVQCPAEADWEIACLARQWNCPILSKDSDFYVFDLPGGYLPFNYFNWTNISGKTNQRYISAQLYTASVLCRWFGGLNKDLLPLCAVLLGNDYSTPKEVDLILSLIDANIAARGVKGKGKSPVSRIAGILGWLSSFPGRAEALAEISQLIKEDSKSSAQGGEKGAVCSKLWALMQEYDITCQSSLALWFSERKDLPGGWECIGFPGCLAKNAAQGQLAASVVDALVMQRVLLMPQVENAKLASSHSTAISIRQAMYGILLHRLQASLTQEKSVGRQCSSGMRMGNEFNSNIRGKGRGAGRGRGQQMIPVEQKAAEVQAQASVVLVEEYDRVDLNLRKRQVEASQVTKPHSLDTVCQASPTARQAILLEILGVPESALCVVPLHLKMAIAVTVFWQREANPTPTPLQLHALLMGFVYGELNLQHDSGPQQNLSQDRGLNAALTRQRIRAGERRGLDLSDAHAYSQWQACLWAALCLNQLLLQALPEPCLSWVFSGTLVHGLAKYLKEGRTPESMLHKSILSEQLFSSLLDTVNKCVIRKTTPKSASSKRSGRRRKGGSARGNTATKEINNRFALLKDEEDT